MRGTDHQQSHMFSYLSPEARVREDHPLRVIRTMVDEVLRALSSQFDRMYASEGRPSIAPEKLLRAQLLQMLYSIRSERLLMEEIDYSVLFAGCWVEFGRRGVGPDGVHQEPGPAAGSRSGQAVPGAGGGAGACEGLDLRMNTSRWTAPCWKPGQEQKVFSARMAKIRPLPMIPAIPR